MPWQKIFILVGVPALFLSCETTKLIYDSRDTAELHRLAVADLEKKSPKIDSIFPELDSSFQAASIRYSNRFLAKETVHLYEQLSYHAPDSLKIIEQCAKNNLDGIVLTYVDFRLVMNQVYFITTDKYFECILYTKIYGKNGKMLYSVIHDSMNDSYDKIPLLTMLSIWRPASLIKE